ncbi:MAG: hypothetical protein ACI970_000742 [Myxococcota bacterium]
MPTPSRAARRIRDASGTYTKVAVVLMVCALAGSFVLAWSGSRCVGVACEPSFVSFSIYVAVGILVAAWLFASTMLLLALSDGVAELLES